MVDFIQERRPVFFILRVYVCLYLLASYIVQGEAAGALDATQRERCGLRVG